MIDNQVFYALLRSGLTGEGCKAELTAEEWSAVYRMAQKQSLSGVIYQAIAKLPGNQQPPMDVAMPWACEVETIRGLNGMLNQEAARLTQLFAGHGRQTAILKGQANARLYADPLSRQPGDIDIWVSGGQESVVTLLSQLGMMPEGLLTTSYHHVHLPATEKGVVVEIHFRPSSGNYNPLTNRRLQRWLEQEIQHTTMTESGFYAPTTRFALVMQLSHIQRHLLSGGIGLRQVCDYYLLLQSATNEERSEVSAFLRRFGLRNTAGALMWLLGEVLQTDGALMLCQPDSYRGKWMLREVMEGGNFGHYAKQRQKGVWQRFFTARLRRLRLMRFDCGEMLWCEINYWKSIVKTLPIRIRYRTLSLRDIPR